MIVNDLYIVRMRDFEVTPSNVRFSLGSSIVTRDTTLNTNVFTNKPITAEEIARAVWEKTGRTLTS